MKIDDNIAIDINHIDKSFNLPHERQNTLKGLVINFRKRGYERQHVLRNFSLTVNKGDFLGIVGRNGSGKSTLLKTLSGIYTPDKGKITINGKLTPFIELGVGFNPELSGRDNVFLNGALLGFSRAEMRMIYDDIVAFAELERFMDQKLKNYSSGMQVRLAFSIAIRADTDILVLDEVLAVGDEAFQRKCYDYFNELKLKGKTAILVTHDMSAVQRFCTRAIVINEGKILYDGEPEEAADIYRDLNIRSTEKSLEKSNKRRVSKAERSKRSSVIGVRTLSEERKDKVLFKPREDIFVRSTLSIHPSIEKPAIQVWFRNPGGLAIDRLIVTNQDLMKKTGGSPYSRIELDWQVAGVYNDGKYVLSIEIDDEATGKVIEVLDEVGEFIVSGWESPSVVVHSKKNFKIEKINE